MIRDINMHNKTTGFPVVFLIIILYQKELYFVQNKLEYFFLYQGKKHSYSSSYNEYF